MSALLSARSRHRNGFKRAVSVLLAAMSMASHRQISFRPRWPNSECMVPCTYRDGISVPDLGGHVMRLSSSFVAPSAVAILSTALLCGPSGTAMSQTATGSATPLPNITVEAPRQVARPHRPKQVANTVASRRTSPTAQTPSAAPGSVMAKLAALEKTSSNCTDGCQTSFKYGNQPWNGCSTSGVFLIFRQRAETYATTKPILSAGRPDCFWVRTTVESGGIAAACSPGGSWPGRSIRSPNSSDQDVASPYCPLAASET